MLKGTVPVSKPAKKRLLPYKKSLIALAEKSTPLDKKKKLLVQHEGNFLSVLLPPVLRVRFVPKMNHTRRMVLVPENTLERLQQRQQILTPPVKQTLTKLDSEMTDLLSSKELDDDEKVKLYSQVLQRYLTFYDQRKGKPFHVKISTPKATETPKTEENEQPTEEPAPEKSVSSVVEQEVMKSVPKIYKSVARQLFDKIKEH